MKTYISSSSGFTSAEVQDIFEWVRPRGPAPVTLTVTSWKGAFRGTAFHFSKCVIIRIGAAKFFPLKQRYPGRVNCPEYYIYNRTEALVYVMAHELRHIWQFYKCNRRGYFPKTRGRYSEQDAEAYALHQLRSWRVHH